MVIVILNRVNKWQECMTLFWERWSMVHFSFGIRVAGMKWIHKLTTKLTPLLKKCSKVLILLKQIQFWVWQFFPLVTQAGSYLHVNLRKIAVLLHVVEPPWIWFPPDEVFQDKGKTPFVLQKFAQLMLRMWTQAFPTDEWLLSQGFTTQKWKSVFLDLDPHFWVHFTREDLNNIIYIKRI